MENQNQIEQCIVALTQLLVQNNRPSNQRQRIQKDIQYLPVFNGDRGTLPSFIDSVTAALNDHPEDEAAVFQIIFNEKIQGSAKNLLKVNPPANWTECQQLLKRHYKSSKDQMTITREISSLRVSSIKDLENKLRILVNDITEFAAFNENGVVMVEIFSGMLLQRIKELVSGSLAYAIISKLRLSEVREIINQFVGQDQNNLNLNLILKNNNKNFVKDCYQHRQNYPSHNFQINSSYTNRNSRGQSFQTQKQQNLQYSQNNQNRAQQYEPNRFQVNQTRNWTPQSRNNDSRANRQRPEPMEVDNISKQETNNMDDSFFIN